MARPIPEARALPAAGARRRLAGLVLVSLLAVASYLDGLGSQHIPKNGDEYAYEHITRMTAASGALLPLRSDLPDMRNTKPPLLFWQGIASTGWGRHWTLWRLRSPSVAYTLFTALVVFVLGFRLSGGTDTGLRAMLAFLAFYSTYRYGRPFLTNPPEVFWLFLPFAVLLLWRPAAFGSRFLVPTLLGVPIGIAFLYRSFALALPAGLGLAWWFLRFRDYRVADFLRKDAGKVALAISVGLAIFASWLLLDPDPGGVFREFVLGESLGRLSVAGQGLRPSGGGPGIWSYVLGSMSHVLGYPVNAGLLAFPVVAFFLAAFERRRELSEAERLLWIWILAVFVAFSFATPRSSRYLLAAMPALALLLALAWSRIGRWAFVLSLLATAAAIAAIALLSLGLERELPGLRPYPPLHWALLAGAEAIVLLGLSVPPLTREIVLPGIFLAYVSLASALGPFDGPLGQFGAAAQAHARGRDVWVPVDFIAKEERYRFLLPGADPHGYGEERGLSAADLVSRYPLVAVQAPLRAGAPEGAMVVGRRLDLRGRQTAAELADILTGKLSPGLVVEELLVEGRRPSPEPSAAGAEGRR